MASCVYNMKFNNFYLIYRKKSIFLLIFLLRVFSVDHAFYKKKQERCFTFKSNLNINLNVYFNKKLISYCIIFETNEYICVAVDCKSYTRLKFL